MGIEIPKFEKEEYLEGTSPFEWLYSHRCNRLEMKQLATRMTDEAAKVGVRNFVALFNDYVASLKDVSNSVGPGNQTDFTGQDIGLWCGNWNATDMGIQGTDRLGFEVIACSHPILPVRRLINIDSGLEKIELAFQRGGFWRHHIFDKSTLADARAIVKLSDYGIAVNSDNAKHLVRYLGDVESLNYDRLESVNSVGRLGWIEGHGFSPYVENLVFDGSEEFRDRFESVKECGSFDEWIQACNSIRKTESVVTRIVLAASFASVLVKPCSCLPFFLHLWGGSEAGKSVGLMMAASVWANPEIGRYIQTFNATSVGKEMGATFYNSMPLMLDELQLVESSRSKFQQMIYELAEGVGRTRGKKTGGVQKTGTWRNCIMTTGEFPLVDSNTAAGAVNRTVEIFCRDIKLFTNNKVGNAKNVARFFQKNYGFAGKQFVKKLQEPEGLEKAISLQDRFAIEISSKGDVTDKQSASAALILAADTLAEEWIFHDGVRLEVQDILPYLATKTKLDQNRRALDFLYDQVSVNLVHFMPDRMADRSSEIWGDLDEKYMYIIKSQFDRLLNENGFNSEAFLGWARQNGEIRVGKDGKSTINHRILGKPMRCVWLKAPADECPEDRSPEDELPL